MTARERRRRGRGSDREQSDEPHTARRPWTTTEENDTAVERTKLMRSAETGDSEADPS